LPENPKTPNTRMFGTPQVRGVFLEIAIHPHGSFKSAIRNPEAFVPPSKRQFRL
jgi:hypothetical protein